MIDLNVFLTIYFVVIGLCIGSFLNVVILRALSGESIVFPASKCPKCGNKLKWWHNIPVLSYVCLRGKCAFCKTKISIQYPIVELLTGILFGLICWLFGLNWNTLFLIIFSCLFIVIAMTDIKEKVIFDFHTYILAGVGLIYNFFNFGNLNQDKFYFWKISLNWSFIDAILGILLGIFLIEGITFLFKLIIKKRGFGDGDTFVIAALGACFGWKLTLILFVLSIMLQAVMILPSYLYALVKNKNLPLCLNIVGFMVVAGLSYYLQNQIFIENLLISLICVVGLVIYGLYIIRNIFKNMSNNFELPMIPFAPALILAGFLVLFFADKLIAYFPF